MEFPAEDFSGAFFAHSNDGAEPLSGDFGRFDIFWPVEANTVVWLPRLVRFPSAVRVAEGDGRRLRPAGLLLPSIPAAAQCKFVD